MTEDTTAAKDDMTTLLDRMKIALTDILREGYFIEADKEGTIYIRRCRLPLSEKKFEKE